MNLLGLTVALSSRQCRYNCIDDVFHSQTIHFMFNEGLCYANTSECNPCETIKSITKVFKEHNQLVPKNKGGVRYPILQDGHIQWLLEKLHVHPNITVKSLHYQLNEVFNFLRLLSINYVSEAIQIQVEFTLKLMRHEPNEFNNEERYSFTLVMT